MHKRYDLFINTQFFDEQESGLQIPQAIKIVQNNDHVQFDDQDSNLRQLLANNNNPEILRATLRIEKIFNNYLFRHFISAWNKIKKQFSNTQIVESKLYKNPSQSLRIQNIKTQYQHQSEDQYKKSIKIKTSRVNFKSQSTDQYKSIHLCQNKNIKIQVQSRENHKINYERAKVLKQIMQKLKYMERTKQDIQYHHEKTNKMILQGKINRLENKVYHFISEGQSEKQISLNQAKKNATSAENDRLYAKVSHQLTNIRTEMQSLKQETIKIGELQAKRREQIANSAENQRQLQMQQRIKLARLQQGHNHLKNQYNYLRNQMHLHQKNQSEQMYHSKMMQMMELQKTKLLQRNPNQFGYSGLNDNQKDGANNSFYQKPTKDGNRYNQPIDPNDWRTRMANPDDYEACC